MADENNHIPNPPPEGEEERAIQTIIKLAQSTLDKTLTYDEAQSLFYQAKARVAKAMAEVTPAPGSGDPK